MQEEKVDFYLFFYFLQTPTTRFRAVGEKIV